MNARVTTYVELHEEELQDIATYVYERAGIKLDQSKRELVKSRLGSRLRSLKLGSYAEYLARVKRDVDGAERTYFVDALTTNLTYFFREEKHFEFLANRMLTPLKAAPRPLRMWSAGCSSGEEPYTLAMVTLETLGDPDVVARCDPRILATDLSTKVLAKAREGVYPADVAHRVPSPYSRKYLARKVGSQTGEYEVGQPVRELVRFAKLNLMGEWPMRGPFDVIFCRNVMIYFDGPTKEALVARYHRLLRKDGFFFVSLAESLTGMNHSFRYVAPGVYRP